MQHALTHLPEGPDTKEKRGEMTALLIMWGKMLDEAIEKGEPAGSMEYVKLDEKLSQEGVDAINSLAEDTFKIFKGRPIVDALFVLVALRIPLTPMRSELKRTSIAKAALLLASQVFRSLVQGK